MVRGARPPCAACKYFHRSCVQECVFAPYFPWGDNPDRFAAVHAVFRSRNVAALIRELPVARRQGAINSLVNQALALPVPRQKANTQQLNAALAAARGQVTSASEVMPSSGERLSRAACEFPWCMLQKEEASEAAASSLGERPPCAACKRLYRVVRAVFGAGYVAQLLRGLPADQRGGAVTSLVYEALARRRKPVYGCASATPILNIRVKQVETELAAKLKELVGYTGQEAASAPFDPKRLPRDGSVTIKQWNVAVEAMKVEMMLKATSDAHAETSSVVTPLHQKVAQNLARQIAEAERLARLVAQAEQLAAFVKVAREEGVTTQEQWAAAVEAARQMAQQIAWAWLLAVVEEVAREQDTTTPQAAADAHAVPGSSSGVTVAILPLDSAEAAPSLIQQQQPSQAQTAVVTVGIRDPDLPKADDQGGDPSQAPADAHAVPGSSSGVTVAILQPGPVEAAPSLVQPQPAAQEQMAMATVGIRDPGLPKVDDQSGDPAQVIGDHGNTSYFYKARVQSTHQFDGSS